MVWYRFFLVVVQTFHIGRYDDDGSVCRVVGERRKWKFREDKIVDWFVVVVAGAVIVHFDALPQTGEMQGMAGHRPGKDAGDIRGIRHKDGFDDFCVMP